MMRKRLVIASALVILVLAAVAVSVIQTRLQPPHPVSKGSSPPQLNGFLPNPSSGENSTGGSPGLVSKSFTLLASLPSFRGVGGEIEGERNPTLRIRAGYWVNVTVINGDSSWHDFVIADLNVSSVLLLTKGEKTSVIFKAERGGVFHYYCDTRGHREAGMEGVVEVEG